jgi:hypothetical protein
MRPLVLSRTSTWADSVATPRPLSKAINSALAPVTQVGEEGMSYFLPVRRSSHSPTVPIA